MSTGTPRRKPNSSRPHKASRRLYSLHIRPNPKEPSKTAQPLGAVSAPANCHDPSPLFPTLEAASEALGALPEGASVHLDRGYDSRLARERLAELKLKWESSGKGKPAPVLGE